MKHICGEFRLEHSILVALLITTLYYIKKTPRTWPHLLTMTKWSERSKIYQRITWCPMLWLISPLIITMGAVHWTALSENSDHRDEPATLSLWSIHYHHSPHLRRDTMDAIHSHIKWFTIKTRRTITTHKTVTIRVTITTIQFIINHHIVHHHPQHHQQKMVIIAKNCSYTPSPFH